MDLEAPRDDAKLDETIAESFPASDAPANTIETGIRSGDVARGVVDHPPDAPQPPKPDADEPR